MNQADLIALIEDAFLGVTRNGGVSLHETIELDNYGTDEERRRARKKDQDGRWQSVPHEDLAEVCGIGGISFFDPIGWRYYLPAYMVWFFTDKTAGESLASDALLFSLCPHKGKLDGFYFERYKSLSEKQSKAVKAFLKFVVEAAANDDFKWCGDSGEAEKALGCYWGGF